MTNEKRYITKVDVDLNNWTDHYPTGCILYHYDQIIDSGYCDNADEFIEFIENYKDLLLKGVTDVVFEFNGYDLNNKSAMECATEIWKYTYKLINGKEIKEDD